MCERISQLLKQPKPEGPLPRGKGRHQREPNALHFTLWELIQAKRQRAGSEQPPRGGESSRPLAIPPEAWETQPAAEFCHETQETKPRRDVQRNEPSTQYQFLSLLSYLLMKLLRANVQEAKNKTARNENISPL